MAVAAKSESDQDLIAAVNLILEKKLATIVSNSYETQVEAGLTDALIWESIATQAGLKGVGLYFSSGDSGDDSYGGFFTPTISFPGSLATVTAVGGTSLAMGNIGQKLWETGWETGLSYLEYPLPTGGGGGDDAGPPPPTTPGPTTAASPRATAERFLSHASPPLRRRRPPLSGPRHPQVSSSSEAAEE